MHDSTKHLKNVVEESLALLADDKNQGAMRADISRRRSLPLYVDTANLQKAALLSASKALAALWNISKPTRAKLPSRVMQYSR